MRYIITRLDYNTVKAEVDGYYPLKGTFEGFFKDLRSYLNRPAFVKRVSYDNHVICMEKLDPEFGFVYTDEYVLDGLLENDARFVEHLNSFMIEYESRKDQLVFDVMNKIERRNIHMKSLRTATSIYKNYCQSGEVEKIDDLEIRDMVIELFKNGDSRVYTSVSCTMEGDIVLRPQFEFNNPSIKRLKVATGVSGVATGALALSSLAFSNPITAFVGVATGIGCYYSYQKKKELNNEEAKKVLAKLSEIYGEMYSDEEKIVEEHKLLKNKTGN